MKNLSFREKLTLISYFTEDTKSLDLPRDGTLTNFENNGVLYCPHKPKEFTNKVTFVINDWAWEYINKHKKEMGMNFWNENIPLPNLGAVLLSKK